MSDAMCPRQLADEMAQPLTVLRCTIAYLRSRRAADEVARDDEVAWDDACESVTRLCAIVERLRAPLDGTDAQALEHALTMTEGERDSIRAVVDAVDAVLRGACVHHASRAEAVRLIVAECTRARSLLAEVALWDLGALQVTAARTLLDRVRAALGEAAHHRDGVLEPEWWRTRRPWPWTVGVAAMPGEPMCPELVRLDGALWRGARPEMPLTARLDYYDRVLDRLCRRRRISRWVNFAPLAAGHIAALDEAWAFAELDEAWDRLAHDEREDARAAPARPLNQPVPDDWFIVWGLPTDKYWR